jgi:hypothetical protein
MTVALLVKILVVLVIVAIAARVAMRRRRREAAAPAPAPRIPRGISPMPAETYSTRDQDLSDPQSNAVDGAVREVVTRYRAGDDAARAAMRDALDTDAMYTLITFARRASVFGMRERDTAWIESGLTALAMLDLRAVDPRDVLTACGLLHHAARRNDADPVAAFTQAAQVAAPEVASILREFPKRQDMDLARDWGQAETATGLVSHGGARDARSSELLPTIRRIAALIEADGRYESVDVEIADTPPFAYLPDAKRLLRKSRACVTASSGLLSGLFVFLVEMRDEESAAALMAAEAQEQTVSAMARLGLARGKLFVLMVCPPDSGETRASLQRFASPVAAILDAVV